MAKLQLERTLQVSAASAYYALAQLNEHQSFIPGCSQSCVTRSVCDESGVWHGSVHYVFELKKYGVHETALLHFRADAKAQTIRFWCTPEDKNGFTAEAVYVVGPSQDEQCRVTLNVEYTLRNKGFAWFAAKPLVSRFFNKYLDLAEKRAQTLNECRHVDLSTQTAPIAPERAVRGFQQLDERSHLARMRVLSCFQEGSVGAEIGTYIGGFANLILETVKPGRLYLIDPWTASARKSQAGSWYDTVDQNYMDEMYRLVAERFAPANVQCPVEIIRDYSTNALRTFRDGELDWVYIDGDHSYDAVLNDLTQSYAKVRPGGHISGDDYRIADNWWKDNVVRAVTEFAATHPVDFVLEDGSQFVLQKRR